MDIVSTKNEYYAFKKYYNAELDRLGYGIQPHRITHYGVRLNNEQFHRFVELYNYPERSKFGEFVTDTVPAKNFILVNFYQGILN